MTTLDDLLKEGGRKAPARAISSDTMDSIQALRKAKGPKRRGRRLGKKKSEEEGGLKSMAEEMNASTKGGGKLSATKPAAAETAAVSTPTDTVDSRDLVAETKPRLLKRSGRRPSRMIKPGEGSSFEGTDSTADNTDRTSESETEIKETQTPDDDNKADRKEDLNASSSSMGRQKRGGRRPSRKDIHVLSEKDEDEATREIVAQG